MNQQTPTSPQNGPFGPQQPLGNPGRFPNPHGQQLPPPGTNPPKAATRKAPVIIVGIVALILGYSIGSAGGDETAVAGPQPTATATETDAPKDEKKGEAEAEEPEATTEPAEQKEEPKKEEPKKEEPKATKAQEQALRQAEQYLKTMPFSQSGLKDQLLFEEHSEADADWAVNNIDADWMEQAELKAKNYLDTMPFSESDLADQLIFDGFTDEEAAHGAAVAFQDEG